MITFFSIPRAFSGQFHTIQRNAIRSWLNLSVEIILFGNEVGVAKMANEFSIRHVPYIERNKFGTPILSGAFKKIYSIASHPVLTYINTDIILMSDFIQSVKKIPLSHYLLVAQRIPLTIDKELPMTDDWEKRIEKLIQKKKAKPKLGSSDFFTFPKHVQFDMPAFAVGRLYWDRWLIFQAKAMGIPVVNGTQTISAIHQQHYEGFEPHGYGEVNLGREAKENLSLIESKIYCFSIFDADYALTKRGLTSAGQTFIRRIRDLEIKLIIVSKEHSVLKVFAQVLVIFKNFLRLVPSSLKTI